MKFEDVEVGMKVVPHSKSIWGGLNGSPAWADAQKRNQPYLIVTSVKPDCADKYSVSLDAVFTERYPSGDFFLADDFELYVEDLTSESLSPDLTSAEPIPDLAARYNTGKVKWSLVDFKSLETMVRVLEFGAKKYAAHNWRKGLPVTQILDSLHRHYVAFLQGEDNDPESGESHVGHMMCNLMFLSSMMSEKPEMDDRWKGGAER